MEILEFRKGDVHILGLSGKLDAASSPELREKVVALIGDGSHRLLLDCSSLEYISSAGLRVLFEAAYKLEELGGAIACCSAVPNVKKVFGMVDLASEVPVFESQQDALRELEQ